MGIIVQLPKDATSACARQLSRTVRGTKRDAQRALAALVTEVAAGKVSATATSLNELLVRWLDHLDGQLSPTTLREYRRLVTTLLAPALGELPLRRVTTQRLDAYYVHLARERQLSAASIRHVHAVMRGALGRAVRWGWIAFNPAAGASPPKLGRREISPPAIHDTRALLAAAEAHDADFGSLLRVLVATGARRGEVCGLRWSDLDIAGGTALICRSAASVAGGTVVKDTQTGPAVVPAASSWSPAEGRTDPSRSVATIDSSRPNPGARCQRNSPSWGAAISVSAASRQAWATAIASWASSELTPS